MANYLDETTDRSIRALLARNWKRRQIARVLGVSRKSVRRRTKEPDRNQTCTESHPTCNWPGRGSVISPFRHLIETQLQARAMAHKELLVLLQDSGYSGPLMTVRR